MSKKETLFQRLISSRETSDIDFSKVRYSEKYKIFIIISTVIVCSVFFILHLTGYDEQNKFNLVPGYQWTGQTIKAEFTYPVYKSVLTYQNEVKEARENTNFVFVLDKSIEAISIRKINSILDSIKAISNPDLIHQ